MRQPPGPPMTLGNMSEQDPTLNAMVGRREPWPMHALID